MNHATTTLRVHPLDESDLRWFFNEADGDMGLRSMFPQQMQQLQLGGGRRGTHTPVIHEPDGRLVAAATRARLVSRALEGIGTRYTGTLRSAYGRLEHAELHGFQELAGLVVYTAAAARLHRRSRTVRPVPDWLARMYLLAQPTKKKPANPDAQRIVWEVRSEAEAQLIDASRAYSRAKRESARRRIG